MLGDGSVGRSLAFGVAGDQQYDAVVKLLLGCDAGFPDVDHGWRVWTICVFDRAAVVFGGGCVMLDEWNLGVAWARLRFIHF